MKLKSLALILLVIVSTCLLYSLREKSINDEPITVTDSLAISVQNILNDVKYLSSDTEFQHLQYRVAGMEGEKKAGKYIEEAFKKSGLDVEQQFFDFHEVLKENRNNVKFYYKNGIEINTTSSEIVSNENTDEAIQGKLIDFGSCSIKDFELNKNQMEGKFLLIKANESTSVEYFTSMEFSKKIKGLIVYDPSFSKPDESIIANKFTLANSHSNYEKVFTVTTISKEDYDRLAKELHNKQEIDLIEYVKYYVEKERRQSQNIIAVKKCENKSADAPLIIVGAHYDCVNAPGANDNATGVATLIELASVLSSKKLNYDLKFVAFGAEEVGLFGSNYFVSNLSKADLRRCILMINIDGPGLGDTFIIGKCTGESSDQFAQNLAFKAAEKNNIIYKKLEFPDSDHFYFSQVGIPTITFASLEHSNKHHSTDLPIDTEYKTFSDLEKEGIVMPEVTHSLNDTYDLIEESNKVNSNFKKVFSVLLRILNNEYSFQALPVSAH